MRQIEGTENQVIEKGIDVWFALEAYEQALFRKFDIVVPMTGDADHEMLIRKLKSIENPCCIILSWNIGIKSSTAKLLKDEACKDFEIGVLIKDEPQIL